MRLSCFACALLAISLSSASCFRHPEVGGDAPDASRPEAATDTGGLANEKDGAAERPASDGASTAADGPRDTNLDTLSALPDAPLAPDDGPSPDLEPSPVDSPQDTPWTGTGGAIGTAGQSGTGGAGGGAGGTGGASAPDAGSAGRDGDSDGAAPADAPQSNGGASTGGSSTGGASTGAAGTGGSSTGGAGMGGSSTGGSVAGGSASGGSSTGGSATSAPLPVTTIATRPANPSKNQTGAFSFTNSSSGVTYQCKLDTSAFASCTQSYTTPALADGSHTLIVKATDREGQEEASPPSYTWVIDTVPPETLIVDHPDSPTRIAAGGFSFGATGETSAVSFECKLDQGSYAACSNPFVTPALAGGTHTLAVRATDAAGNTDATPATFTWEFVAGSSGCGKTPSLNNSPDTTANFNTITSSGTSRQYILRYPTNYSNTRPYRLVITYHWYTGNASQVLDCNQESYPCSTTKSAFFDLWNLANDSTIFIAPEGLNQGWANTGGQDVVFTDDILDQVKKDLCIDERRIFAHGYQYGGQLAATLGCQRAEVFRGIVVLSGGLPSAAGACTGTTPVAYYGAVGSQESQSLARTAFTHFADIDGCTSPTFPSPPTGGHTCVSTAGCSSGHPTRWCTFDHGLMATPVDTGASISWQPAEVWSFLSQF